MAKQSLIEKIKERKVGRTLAVYLGSAWVFIEAFNFLIDKYNWNAGHLASGVYYYKLEAGGFIKTNKLILMK